jgi:hypothetical protein
MDFIRHLAKFHILLTPQIWSMYCLYVSLTLLGFHCLLSDRIVRYHKTKAHQKPY